MAKRGHGYLLALVVFPYLTSLLVRTYAWMVLLSDDGPISGVLLAKPGIVSHPVKLLFSVLAGAMIGMVHIMLPVMILPLYSVMHAIPELADARRGRAGRRTGPRLPQGVPAAESVGSAQRMHPRFRHLARLLHHAGRARQPQRHNALEPERVTRQRCARLQEFAAGVPRS